MILSELYKEIFELVFGKSDEGHPIIWQNKQIFCFIHKMIISRVFEGFRSIFILMCGT